MRVRVSMVACTSGGMWRVVYWSVLPYYVHQADTMTGGAVDCTAHTASEPPVGSAQHGGKEHVRRRE